MHHQRPSKPCRCLFHITPVIPNRHLIPSSLLFFIHNSQLALNGDCFQAQLPPNSYRRPRLGSNKKGFDMVVGARRGKHYSRNFRSLVLRKLFRFLAEFSCGESIPDINSGFRIFDREKALSFRGSLSTGFSFTTTITLLFFLNHYFVGYFPIEYKQRIGTSHVHFFRDSLRSLQIIVTVIAQYNPLKLYLLQIITLLSGYTVIALLHAFGPLQQPIYWQLGSIGWSALNLITALAITTTAFMGRQKPKVLRSTL